MPRDLTEERRWVMGKNSPSIRRHPLGAIIMHWFNTACWLFLLATGLGLIDNPALQPLGMWWVRWMHGLFGGGAQLLQIHIACGAVWSIGFLLYGIFFIKRVTIPFVKEMLSFSPKQDLTWLIRKPLTMTLGPKMMTRLGMNSAIPDQGFYNIGQKLFGIPALFGGVVIAITGGILTFSKLDWMNPVWVQWSILIHFLTAGLVFAGLLIHIYMAAIAKGETPALISMFTGRVPEGYAKSHHRLWFEETRTRKSEPGNSTGTG
jgi:formate dehydrogenase subunit gamma